MHQESVTKKEDKGGGRSYETKSREKRKKRDKKGMEAVERKVPNVPKKKSIKNK